MFGSKNDYGDPKEVRRLYRDGQIKKQSPKKPPPKGTPDCCPECHYLLSEHQHPGVKVCLRQWVVIHVPITTKDAMEVFHEIHRLLMSFRDYPAILQPTTTTYRYLIISTIPGTPPPPELVEYLRSLRDRGFKVTGGGI